MQNKTEFYPCTIAKGYSEDAMKSYFDLFIDADMVEDYDLLFEKYENYANGYGWEGLIITLARECAPEIEQELDFDSEAGTFVCYLTNEHTLLKLATLISQMCANPDFMETMLSKVPTELRG